VLCDLEAASGAPFALSPRAVLRRQIERARDLGLSFRMASELEFHLFADACALPPSRAGLAARASAGQRQDCHLAETDGTRPLIRKIVDGLAQAGIGVEYWKGESGVDQHEIVLEHCDALEAADRAAILKHAVKVAARRAGRAASFLAKLSENEDGNGGHAHCSIHPMVGSARLADGDGRSTLDRFVDEACRRLPEMMPLVAPLPNSYKRLRPGSFAPCDNSRGDDDRSVALRVVGGQNPRVEFRVPGADANLYLAYAALIAAGLDGLEEAGCAAPESCPLPRDLSSAVAAFRGSFWARRSFGDDVVNYFSRLYGHEADVAHWAVSDWELDRYWREA